MEKGLSVIVPAFNEEDGILQTLNNLKKALSDADFSSEIIVVNDGSTDGTKRQIEHVQPGIKLIDHAENAGYGASIISGVEEATYDFICIIDSDGTYPPNAIPNLFKEFPDCDMAVGARIGKKIHIPFVRKPAKFLLNVLANYITRKKIPDLNSGLRIFRKTFIDKFRRLFPSGFSFTTTLTVLLLCNNYRVKFIPIEYYKRSGKSKIAPVKDTLNFFLLILKMTTYFRPLRFFIPLSAALFMVGFIKLINDIIRYHFHIGGNTILILIFAVQFFVLGLLADLIVSLNVRLK